MRVSVRLRGLILNREFKHRSPPRKRGPRLCARTRFPLEPVIGPAKGRTRWRERTGMGQRKAIRSRLHDRGRAARCVRPPPLSRSNGSARAELCSLARAAARAGKAPRVVDAKRVEVAALVGDTARATMLAALMGGQSLTATELAYLS